MKMDPLTPETSTRICNHMNSDHKKAIISYAKHYGGLKKPSNALMVSISSKLMKLEVDGQLVEIHFDHTLTDSEDAHRTLIAMLQACSKSPQ